MLILFSKQARGRPRTHGHYVGDPWIRPCTRIWVNGQKKIKQSTCGQLCFRNPLHEGTFQTNNQVGTATEAIKKHLLSWFILKQRLVPTFYSLSIVWFYVVQN